ncbi:hypothetical protein EIP86_008914 [Pleurotus ostreatoroseus]|nr:hypothetical protein EIP86_008914 [Pleurotus ostreatoroseus]
MHNCLYISEILQLIFQYASEDNKSPLVALACTCRLFSEPALDLLWREVDDVSPFIKCMPGHVWAEESFTRTPTDQEWMHLHRNVHRIRKFTFCSQWYSEDGMSCRLNPASLAQLSQHVVSVQHKRRAPLLPNLNVLHFDYYERYPGLCVANCFPHIAGRALEEIHLHCDEDMFPEGLAPLSLSSVLPQITKVSPNVSYVTIWDSRNYPSTKHSSGVSGLLMGLCGIQHFTCSLPVRNNDIAALARQPKLLSLSIALFMDRAEGPFLPSLLRPASPFRCLHTLVLQVAQICLATSFMSFPQTETIRKLRIATPMWSDEKELENCFKAISRHRRLQELSIAVVSTRIPAAGHLPFGTSQCLLSSATLALLFPLDDMRSFSLSAQDRARFETDLDDAGVDAMARAWTQLRSLTIVQGSWCPRGLTLPPARTTMRALVALREHCPHLTGLSMGFDTSAFDNATLQAAITGQTAAENGASPHALRKLNIDTRSTPVSNPSIAAQVLRGLFPQLHNIHDGSSVAWDQKRTDWQEVSSILRGMIDGVPVVDDGVSEYDYMDEDTE